MKRWNRSILGWSLVLSMVGGGTACGSSGDSDKDDHGEHPEGKMDAGPTGKVPSDKDDENEERPGDAGKGTGSAKNDGGSKQPDAGRGSAPATDGGMEVPRDPDRTDTEEDAGEPDPSTTPGTNPDATPTASPMTCDTTRCTAALAQAKQDPILRVIADMASVCCINPTTCGGTFEGAPIVNGAPRCYSEQEILGGLMMLPTAERTP